MINRHCINAQGNPKISNYAFASLQTLFVLRVSPIKRFYLATQCPVVIKRMIGNIFSNKFAII